MPKYRVAIVERIPQRILMEVDVRSAKEAEHKASRYEGVYVETLDQTYDDAEFESVDSIEEVTS